MDWDITAFFRILFNSLFTFETVSTIYIQFCFLQYRQIPASEVVQLYRSNEIYCHRPTAKCDSKHIRSAFYQTVAGERFEGGVWLFLRSMVYFIFLKKGGFSSPNDQLGYRAHSASYSVSISRPFPRGKTCVVDLE